jgi:hypothetical protein
VSARDELEAAIWRRLRRYKLHATARELTADVDAIIQAAHRYAQADWAAAERRTDLALALAVEVHWQHPGRAQHKTACSATKTATTPIRSAVTCRACMATGIWKAAA